MFRTIVIGMNSLLQIRISEKFRIRRGDGWWKMTTITDDRAMAGGSYIFSIDFSVFGYIFTSKLF